jgi:hypothetical protein
VLVHGFWVVQRTGRRSRTIELDASHASLTSQPGAIVDLIDQAVIDLGATSVGAAMTAAAPA